MFGIVGILNWDCKDDIEDIFGIIFCCCFSWSSLSLASFFAVSDTSSM